MHIIRAEIQDFKRVSVAAIDAGDIVEITGGNKQGKSSVLDAIEAALAGKDHAPKEPIRRGAEKARVVLDLGDIIVERVWTQKSDRIVVKNREGASYPRPQERLSALVGGLAFDPLGFMGLKPAEQRATLLRIIGVDLESFAARREVVFQRRTGTNRDLKAAKARLDGVPEVPADVPDQEISVSDLSDQLRKAMEQQQHNDIRRQNATSRENAILLAHAQARQAGEEVRRLEAALRAARETLTRLEGDVEGLTIAAQEARAEADALVDPDLGEIQERIGAADATNRLVRQKHARAALVQEVERLVAATIADSAAIGAIDQEQEAALAGASVPVEGLGVNEDGVTFNGLPLDQASGMEQIRVCTAIGAALNPELKIALVRQGNDMEPKHLAAFYAECQAHGLQAWVERISGIGSGAIVIEEGVVAGAAGATIDGGATRTEVDDEL